MLHKVLANKLYINTSKVCFICCKIDGPFGGMFLYLKTMMSIFQVMFMSFHITLCHCHHWMYIPSYMNYCHRWIHTKLTSFHKTVSITTIGTSLLLVDLFLYDILSRVVIIGYGQLWSKFNSYMLGPENSGDTRSILLPMMPWLLWYPCHQ